MRQFRKVILTFLALFFGIYAFAGSLPGEEMQKVIRKGISYPQFAKESQLQGLVIVKFEVNEQGYVRVDEMNASHSELAQYVQSQLESMRLDPRKTSGTHFAKFTFRYEER